MKNQILALTVGLLSITSFAQKNELKAVEKAIKKGQLKEAKATIVTLEGTEESMDSKYKAKYYFLKGSAYGKSNVQKAAAAYNNLFEEEKATGKQKYTKLAKPKLNELIQYVSGEAIKQYNAKDYKNAKYNFELTYKLSPADTTFLYNAAISASLDNDYDTALMHYKNLQEVNYTGITTQYFAVNKESSKVENLGSKENRNTMLKFGKYDNPTQKSTASKQADIIKNIGFILMKQGKTEEAIVAIKEARKSNPKDLNLLLNEAQLYIDLKQMDKFGALMQEAITLDPKNPSLFFNLGVVNQNEKKTEDAIKYYKQAIELNPEYGDAYMNLAITILSGEQAIVEEMNKNLNNFKKYDELENKQKDLYKKALPFLEKADSIKRSIDTVKSLLNIYDILEMTDKAEVLRPIYKEMRS